MEILTLKRFLRLTIKTRNLKNCSVLYHGKLTLQQVTAPSIYIIYSTKHYYVLQVLAKRSGKLHFVFIDSLGRDPVVFYKITSPVEYTYEYSKFQLQPYKSSLCSVYCLYFANQLARGRSLKQVISKFSKTDLKKNDKLICAYYKKLLRNVTAPKNFPYCSK